MAKDLARCQLSKNGSSEHYLKSEMVSTEKRRLRRRKESEEEG